MSLYQNSKYAIGVVLPEVTTSGPLGIIYLWMILICFAFVCLMQPNEFPSPE